MHTPASLDLFEYLVLRILPLYALVALGYLYAKQRPGHDEPVSYFLIYFAAPIVVFGTVAQAAFQARYLYLPLAVFLICCAVCATTYTIGKRLWQGSTPNLAAYASTCANTGNYGIPVVALLFPADIVGIYVLATCGLMLFDCTFGFYITARGAFTAKESIRRVLRLPSLYAGALGLAVSARGLPLPFPLHTLSDYFIGTQTVLGCMLIGFGLTRFKNISFERSLLPVSFAAKFLLWPSFMLGFIALDVASLHLFSDDIHKMLLLLSVLPMPVSTLAYANNLGVQPEKAGIMVFASTLFALFFLPLSMALWG